LAARIEDRFGGFSRAMWEVGQRYARACDALVGPQYEMKWIT
jgi:hypothetical protein